MAGNQSVAAVKSQKRSEASYKGLADDIWAQHSQLKRFDQTCKDEEEIRAKIKIARDALAEAGKLADAAVSRRGK